MTGFARAAFYSGVLNVVGWTAALAYVGGREALQAMGF